MITNSNIINTNSLFELSGNKKNISTPKFDNPKKFIEMSMLPYEENENNNINNIQNDYIKNKNYFKEEEIAEDEEKIEFDRCFDCNYFWIHNETRDDQKIIQFIKDNTNFKEDDIENLNLNNVYEFFNKENESIFNKDQKKIKFKIQGYGLDNYARIKNLDVRFGVIVTYFLE